MTRRVYEARSRSRRRAIVDAAAELFSEKGYHATTVHHVARRAGVSTGLVYQYAANKEELLRLVLVEVVQTFHEAVERAIAPVSEPVARCRIGLEAYCHAIDRHRHAVVLAYRSTGSVRPEARPEILAAELRTISLYAANIRDAIAEGAMKPVDPEVAANQILLFAQAWALKHWYFRDRYDLDQYMAFGRDFLLSGLLTEEGWRRWNRAREGKDGAAVSLTAAQ